MVSEHLNTIDCSYLGEAATHPSGTMGGTGQGLHVGAQGRPISWVYPSVLIYGWWVFFFFVILHNTCRTC
jgi:hypothetical protein